MRLRTKRLLISTGYFVVSNAVLLLIVRAVGSSGGDDDALLAVLLVGNHLLLFALPGYRRYIQRAFLSSERCYNCGLLIGLTGLWGCGCGFNMVRHVLARCPGCKTYTDQVGCPRCGVTIHV